MAERITHGRARFLNHSTPKWVMVGLEWDGPGVLLMASKQLGSAKIDWEAGREYFFRSIEEMKANFRPSLALTVTIADEKSYVLIAAESYPAAIQALFGEWTPEDDTAAVTSPMHLEITAGAE